MTDKELCAWLREHSSGVYRNSALGADRIEELLEARDRHKIEQIVLEVLEKEARCENVADKIKFAYSIDAHRFPLLAKQVAERLTDDT